MATESKKHPSASRPPSADSCSILWHLGRASCRIFTSICFDLKVYGTHNVPKTGGVLLVANHASFLDPLIVAVQLRRPVSFFARATLFDHPIFGWLIRSLHAFPVHQGKGDRAAVQEAIDRLREGHVLNLYPEGTRSEDGELAPLQSGAALIVRRANVPIVPVAIVGSFQAWPCHKKIFRSYPIRVMYGPPLNVDHLKADQITKLIEQTLRSMIGQLRENSSQKFE